MYYLHLRYMISKVISFFKKTEKDKCSIKVPINSFEKYFDNFSTKKELIEIENFIENSLNYIDEDGNNIVHICFICATDFVVLNHCLNILQKNNVNFKFLNKRQYLPIHSLIINNPKFYENNLGRIFPKIFNIYNVKDIDPIYKTSHPYYIYEGFCNFSNKDDFYQFLLKEAINESFTYPKVIAGKEFLDKEKIKLFPVNEILTTYDFLSNKNLMECVYEITGRKSKQFKKIVINEIINKKYINLDSVMTICKSIDNDDICLNLINEFFANNYSPFEGEMFYLSRQMIPGIRSFISEFTPYLFIKYFLKDEQRCAYCKDTLLGFYKLKKSYDTILDIRNYKDLKSYHDAVIKELTKNKQKPFDLNQDKINYLNGKKIDNLELIVPTSNHDLIIIGTELNLCIGTLGYAERIAMDREKMIFFKDQKGIVKIVCSMNNNFLITEIKKKNNEILNQQELKDIQKFLLQNKKD